MPEYNNRNNRQRAEEDAEGKLFVGGLAWDSTEESIKSYFEKFGTVEAVNLKRNKEDPSKHRGFCFVKFTSQDYVDSVLNQKEPHFIDGSKVDPKSACPTGVKPEQRTKKIFVGGLQEQTTEEKLMEYFGQFGEIQNSIEFSVDRNTHKRRGFCFIEFANEGIVDRIVKSQFHEVAGKRLETKRALSKQQQAEEAARQAAQNPGGARSVAAVHAMAGAAAYGAQPVAMSPYAQPVIYIHPDSLSTAYPNSALGYQTLAAGYPSAVETLYQPYAAGQSTARQGAATYTTQRHTPYSNKKY